MEAVRGAAYVIEHLGRWRPSDLAFIDTITFSVTEPTGDIYVYRGSGGTRHWSGSTATSRNIVVPTYVVRRLAVQR